MNFRENKVKTILGIPGTGLSYSQTETSSSGAGGSLHAVIVLLAVLFLIWAIA